jgi:hypothetical protein
LFSQRWQPYLGLVATCAVIIVAVLALRRLPAGVPGRPAIRPPLALSAAWLFFWPYQLPWYDAMIICVLVFFPASRLDWLVLTRLTIATISAMPGNPGPPASYIGHLVVFLPTPLILFGAAIGLAALCLSRRWQPRQPDAPPGPLAPVPDEMLRPTTG